MATLKNVYSLYLMIHTYHVISVSVVWIFCPTDLLGRVLDHSTAISAKFIQVMWMSWSWECFCAAWSFKFFWTHCICALLTSLLWGQTWTWESLWERSVCMISSVTWVSCSCSLYHSNISTYFSLSFQKFPKCLLAVFTATMNLIALSNQQGESRTC